MSFINYLFIGASLLLFTQDAQAYLDPGTGSFIFQLLIGGFLGGIVAIKLKFKQIKTFFVSKSNKNTESKE